MGWLYGTQNTFLSYQMGSAMNLDNLGLEDNFSFFLRLKVYVTSRDGISSGNLMASCGFSNPNKWDNHPQKNTFWPCQVIAPTSHNESAFLDHRNWHGSNDVPWGTAEGIAIACKIYGLSLSTSWEYHLWYDSPKSWENNFAITYWYYLVLYPEWCSRMGKKNWDFGKDGLESSLLLCFGVFQRFDSNLGHIHTRHWVTTKLLAPCYKLFSFSSHSL